MNFTIITKNHEADPEIRYLKKSIPEPFVRVTAIPPAWEFSFLIDVGFTELIYSFVFDK